MYKTFLDVKSCQECRRPACEVTLTRGIRRSIHSNRAAASSRRSTMLHTNIWKNAGNMLQALHPKRHRHDSLVRLREQRSTYRNCRRAAKSAHCSTLHSARAAGALQECMGERCELSK